MGKRKAVISADDAALDEIEALVRSGRFTTVSQFMQEAIREKLARLKRTRLEEQVARYCAAGTADDDLIDQQALDDG